MSFLTASFTGINREVRDSYLIRIPNYSSNCPTKLFASSYTNIKSLPFKVKLFYKKIYMPKINRLAEVFDENKVTNREIAKLIGKSEETVSRWSNNHRQPPLDDLYIIAKFLNIDIRELLYPSEWVMKK